MADGQSISIPAPRVLTIILADDSEQWRLQIRRILDSRLDWEIVSEAADGKQALEKVQELCPDVVLLDIGMPVMNGLAAGREIRRICPGANIIFVTESSLDTIREAALEIGEGYVLKRNALRELLPAVAKYLPRV